MWTLDRLGRPKPASRGVIGHNDIDASPSRPELRAQLGSARCWQLLELWQVDWSAQIDRIDSLPSLSGPFTRSNRRDFLGAAELVFGGPGASILVQQHNRLVGYANKRTTHVRTCTRFEMGPSRRHQRRAQATLLVLVLAAAVAVATASSARAAFQPSPPAASRRRLALPRPSAAATTPEDEPIYQSFWEDGLAMLQATFPTTLLRIEDIPPELARARCALPAPKGNKQPGGGGGAGAGGETVVEVHAYRVPGVIRTARAAVLSTMPAALPPQVKESVAQTYNHQTRSSSHGSIPTTQTIPHDRSSTSSSSPTRPSTRPSSGPTSCSSQADT